MWTVISWSRERNEWQSMTGYSSEERATQATEDSIRSYGPDVIISLSDPTGKVIWAAIGDHPVIGRCPDSMCACQDYPTDQDHTLVMGSSNV